MKYNFFYQITLLLLLSVFTLSCSDSKPNKLITTLSDDFNTSVVDINRKVQITVYAEFDDGSKEDFTKNLLWSSSDETLATVVDGLVETNSSTGLVNISYKTVASDINEASLYEKTYEINIRELILKSVSLSKQALSLSEGESSQLKAYGTFLDSTNAKEITQEITDDCNWTSSDNTVSTVSSSGLVKALSEGNATINAKDLELSESADITVKKITYVSLEINNTITSFNKGQTLPLYALGVTSTNSKVPLDSSEITWSSEDPTIISLNNNIATARQKGITNIVATLKSNSSITDTMQLTVLKDTYLRFFKNGIETSFPYAGAQEYSNFPSSFDSFTIRAVGQDFIVKNLKVTDFNNSVLPATEAYFSGISKSTVLFKDTDVNFKLFQNSLRKELHYSFEVDDSFSSSFSQKYIEE